MMRSGQELRSRDFDSEIAAADEVNVGCGDGITVQSDLRAGIKTRSENLNTVKIAGGSKGSLRHHGTGDSADNRAGDGRNLEFGNVSGLERGGRRWTKIYDLDRATA